MKAISTIFFLFAILVAAPAMAQKEINWMTIEEAEAAVAKDPKPVFIDVYTTWCGWCKRMDKTTFIDPDFVDYMNANYYAVKMNGEEKRTMKYRGEEFKFVARGRRGYNELPAGFLQGALSYPTYVILDKELTPLQSFKGYRKAEEFLPIVVFLGEARYKQTDWEQFLSTWESKE